ncbi:hypothetical protein N431DRAFT_470800 [Stipitochalara longipes BDJ]|nr:hypothetical protein N431DRAFT_470800 [Stipitochalara longipes BDJ]
MGMISIKQIKAFPWEKCPVDVRETIFDKVDNNAYGHHFGWGGWMPSIIIALGALKNSYDQALQRFTKVNEFSICMSPLTGYSIRDMNQAELDTIRMVKPQMSEIVDTLWMRRNEDDPDRIAPFPVLASLDSFPKFPFWLEGFKQLKVVIADITILYNTVDGDSGLRYQRINDSIMDRVCKKTGVQGQYVDNEWRVRAEVGVYIWEAQPRQSMDWSQRLGSIWKRPLTQIQMHGHQDQMSCP